jgi:heterodisulfide reductase subunit C
MVEQVLFILMLTIGVGFFVRSIGKIRRNIFLGRPLQINDRKPERWKTMARVALGQSKMVVRPVAGFFHILIYVGFVLINIEVLEIVLDGITGSHRLFAAYLGGFYAVAIGFFEILAVLVMLACIVFLARRISGSPPRLSSSQLKGWANTDALLILGIELVLMTALLLMNAAEGAMPGAEVAPFLVSSLISPLFSGLSAETLHWIERLAWWFHAAGILGFLNYLPFSKHFHIVLAFPNVWYSNLEPKGKFANHQAVKREVELMMNPEAEVQAAPVESELPVKFGAKDVQDLSWKQLLDAYSCTECGRCSSECPAHQTGKLLSPRKIMMDTRDRLEEVGRNIDAHGKEYSDGKSLLGDFITEEELWACTTCNACTQACPVNIDPLSIIMDLRRELVLEQSKAPGSLTAMFNNVENNAAPWPFSPTDRGNWRQTSH